MTAFAASFDVDKPETWGPLDAQQPHLLAVGAGAGFQVSRIKKHTGFQQGGRCPRRRFFQKYRQQRLALFGYAIQNNRIRQQR
ncbi:MAG: hypothetical protein HC900_02935, partial [Methylacidiphilales bacterium]|nr:hypothetical protein [Candidatus Methylacidiphilales bacterium]